jgi:hypothetical protein
MGLVHDTKDDTGLILVLGSQLRPNIRKPGQAGQQCSHLTR